ncbi:MAG: GGDEF domain-containing protein [Treponema sp.]|nr:GGDEF domain-containing protein [Treponema sp.]
MTDALGDVLNQYNSMQDSGLLYRIEDLKKENRDLNRAISDISRLVSYTRVDSMIDFLIKRLNDNFIPESLVFFVEPPRQGPIRQFFYSNLKKSDKKLPDKYYSVLKGYFESLHNPSNNGFAVPFDNIKLECQDCFDQDFLDLKPKFVIPLISIGGVYSVIILSEKFMGEPYTASEQFYMHRLFSVLAVTMQNGLHYEVSITEPKTGLYTYDYFLTRMQEKIVNVQRYNRTAAMLIIDIDFFKKFNDTWGHLVGDKVLLALADVLKKTVRGEDCVARFGGEEFSILLSECEPEGVMLVAERIRRAVSQIVLYEGEEQLHITVSVGGCVINSTPGLTPTYIFKKADKALYYSKEHGRNQSTIFKLGLLDLINIKNGDTGEDE